MGYDKSITGHALMLDKSAFVLNAWTPDQDPVIGPLISIDTETELFVAQEFPDLVMLQVTAGQRIDLVHWRDADMYIDKLLRYNLDSKIVFVNAAYDLGVLGRDDLYSLVDERRIVDMMDRYKLWEISERGFVRSPASLKNMSKKVLDYDLPKDDDLRLNFSRNREPSFDQLKYGAYDVAATWLLGMRIPSMPTEADSQIMGSIVLDAVSRTGMLTDLDKFHSLRERYLKDMHELLFKLEKRGYCPLLSKSSADILRDGLSYLELDIPISGITGPKMEYLLYKVLYNCYTADLESMQKVVKQALGAIEREETPLLGIYECKEWLVLQREKDYEGSTKKERVKQAWKDVDEMDLKEVLKLTEDIRCNPFKNKLRKRLAKYARDGLRMEYTYELSPNEEHNFVLSGIGLDEMADESTMGVHAMAFVIRELCMIIAGKNLEVPKFDIPAVRQYFVEKGEMYGNYTEQLRQCRTADDFMQNRLALIEMRNPKVEFPRTDAGKIQLSGKDKWILKKYSVKDEILDLYMDYKHKEKLLSTYLNDEHIWEDGRVHTRFENYLRTGRTSSSKPNIQNVPGSDGIRSMYIPKRGHYMASIDYSQLELCSLAQHCYTKLGRSRMRELINAKIDLHSWFAGKTAGIITEENDYDGTEESRLAVISMCEDIKANHNKLRKNAKAANFGFPGGMSAQTFLNTQRAYGDTEITLEECNKLRTDWFKAFPEMEDYMKPTGDIPSREDRIRFESNNLRLYQAENCAGVIRRKCTFNSACNFPFQSLAAVGAKRALWKVWRDRRYSHLIINFVHDELLFELPIETAAEDVKNIQALMEEAMREVIKDVRIEAEGCLMEEWDKRAEPEYDLFGNLTVWRPKEAA